MVLIKIILLFFVTINCFAKSEREVVLEMENALLKNQYSLVLDLFDEYEDEIYSGRVKPIILVANAYEKSGDEDQAISILEKFVSKHYRKETKYLARRAFRRKKNSKHKNNENLKLVYFKLAQLLTKKYTATYIDQNKKIRESYLKKAIAYIRLVRSISEETEHIDELQEEISTKREYFQAIKYKNKFYLFTGIIAWQDIVTVYDTSLESRIPLLNSSKGNCLGAGISRSNIHKEYFFDLCYITAKSTVDSSISDFTFNQNNVAVTGFFGGPGMTWKSFGDRINIGGQIVMLSRTGDWDVQNSNQNIDLSRLNAYGLSFISKWHVWNFSFIGRFARLLNTKSSTISISSALNF